MREQMKEKRKVFTYGKKNDLHAYVFGFAFAANCMGTGFDV